MARTLDERSPKRDQRLQSLEAQAERDRRALDALHNISLACRGLTSFEQLFAAITHELTALLPFDACYIAVCDTQRADSFRAVLLVDEGVAEYCENLPFGLLTGALIRDRQPLLYGDLAAERAQMERAPDTFGNHAEAFAGLAGRAAANWRRSRGRNLAPELRARAVQRPRSRSAPTGGQCDRGGARKCLASINSRSR